MRVGLGAGTDAWSSADGGHTYGSLPQPNEESSASGGTTGFAPGGGDTDLATAPARNGSGTYNVAALAPGQYLLRVEAKGFKTVQVPVFVQIGVVTPVNVTLEVGSETVVINVEATVVCSCGNTWKTRSTKEQVHLDVCSKCHPFFTGEQRIMDTAGRVERFKKRYGLTT